MAQSTTFKLKPYHAASVGDDDTVVDEANIYAEGSVFRSQAGTGSAVDDPGGSVDDPGGGNTDDLSPRLPRRREFKRHLFVVDSLDKHMQKQKEKELIRLRRFIMPAARTTRARSAQFRLRRELPCTRVVQILPAAQTTRTRH